MNLSSKMVHVREPNKNEVNPLKWFSTTFFVVARIAYEKLQRIATVTKILKKNNNKSNSVYYIYKFYNWPQIVA